MYQLYHFSDKTPTETVDFIINILQQLPIKKLVVETNSIGNIYLDLLKKKNKSKKYTYPSSTLYHYK